LLRVLLLDLLEPAAACLLPLLVLVLVLVCMAEPLRNPATTLSELVVGVLVLGVLVLLVAMVLLLAGVLLLVWVTLLLLLLLVEGM
jgi:hypothetical protein